MKVTVIIQARMSSTRLPGKVLKELLGEPVLKIIVDRVRKAKLVDNIVIATTTKANDTPISKFADKNKITCFRGSEDDVLGRIIGAADLVNADIVVRVTADTPFISFELIDHLISEHIANNADYTTFQFSLLPVGVSAEVFSLPSLKKSYLLEKDPYFLEEMNEFIINNPHIFRTFYLPVEPTYIRPDYRLTLDTQEDFDAIGDIMYVLGKDVPLNNLLEYLDKNKQALEKNKSILQKPNKIVHPLIFFRVDASNNIGMGHLQRCIVLANELTKRMPCRITFLIRDYTEALCKLSQFNNFSMISLKNQYSTEDELNFIKQKIITGKPDLLITDVMGIDSNYTLSLTQCLHVNNLNKHKNHKHIPLFVIDDLGNKEFYSDVVLNSNPNVSKNMYKVQPYTKLLLGSEYLLIDSSYYFRKNINLKVKNILVSMGGSDNHILVVKVLEALNNIPSDFFVDIVLGSGFKHIDAFNNAIASFKKKYNVHKNLNDLLGLVKKTDLAVISGGFTKYEVSASGTPALVICQEDFEVKISKQFEKNSSFVVLGLGTTLSIDNLSCLLMNLINDFELRQSLNKRTTLIEPGLFRITEEILKLIYAHQLGIDNTNNRKGA